MRRVAVSLLAATFIVLAPVLPGSAARAASSDQVSIQITGGVNYTNSGTLTSGNLTVGPLLGPVGSVTGTGTIPGTNGGEATVTFDVAKFWIFSVYLGHIAVSDPGAGVNTDTPVLFAQVPRVGQLGATSTSTWIWWATSPCPHTTRRGRGPHTDPPPPTAPVLGGAGDGAGCLSFGDEATADLLDNIPGTVFTAGDNAYFSGSASEFANCYEPSWGRHKARTYPAAGNHDYVTAGGPYYHSYFGAGAGTPGQGWYSYDVGAWHVVVLNSNCSDPNVGGCGAGSAQEQWLRADLAAHPAACTAAIWHHPRFSSSSHGSSTSVKPLWQALQDYGAEIVLVGHDHTYERFARQDADGNADPNGIREFVVGTGGISHYAFNATLPNSEVRNNDTYGVIKLTLHATSYDWEFVPEAGRTFTDSGTEACH